MAEKKISELEQSTLAAMVAAGGFVPVANPGVGTFKVPTSEFGSGGESVTTFQANYEGGEVVWPNADDVLSSVRAGKRVEIIETNTANYKRRYFQYAFKDNYACRFISENNGRMKVLSLEFIQGSQTWNWVLRSIGVFTAGDGIAIDPDNKISVKLGTGLDFQEDGGLKVVSLDNETVEVVETVQKLEGDIDTKLTTNMSMSDIDEIYDFADSSTYGSVNGGFLLTQAFTVPINNGLRIDDTLIGIYAKQGYSTKVILGLYEFNFDGNNGTGQTLWVGDTGPVTISGGRNEFPLKNLRSTEQELLASRVYFAAIYLPSGRSSSGLLLAGCPGYGARNGNINAIPRFTIVADNIDIDTTDPSATIENYGPWASGYNERPTVPRFFMQIRNKDGGVVYPTDPFDNMGSYTLSTNTLSAMGFATAPQSNGVLFKKVIPNKSVTVKKWSWIDDQQTGSYGFGWIVTDHTMASVTNQNDVTITDTDNGDGTYTHTATHATGIALSNAVYWFPVHGSTANLMNSVVGSYEGTETDDLRLCNSGYNVQYGYSEDVTTANAYLKLTDSDGNEWVI